MWPSTRLLIPLAVLASASRVPAQRVQVRAAPEIRIPLPVDGNSPSFWRNGQFYFLTSTGQPVIAGGAHQLEFSWTGSVEMIRSDRLPIWIESAWVDSDGTVYGWYHHEPGGLCPGTDLTAPVIGAAVSYDGGRSFFDIGLILTSGDPVDCTAQNGFFAGGHGDFSVILDREGKFFYFFFTNYGGPEAAQGVAAARMAFEDRNVPVGAVFKYFEGGWTEPGLGGRVAPIFPARASWLRADADSLWGPAVHWNSYLERYVMLMNRACCEPRWPQEGIYASFSLSLSDPRQWSAPVRILHDIGFAPGYYPQVMGLDPGENDTVAGRSARLFVQGRSKWQILFEKPDPIPDREDAGLIPAGVQ